MIYRKQHESFKIGIMCHASFGGSARVATQLAAALADRGHAVHLFTLGPPAWGHTPKVHVHEIPRQHNKHAARLHTNWHPREQQAFLSYLLRVIQTERLDILHFHYAVPFAFLAEQVRLHLGPAAPVLIGTLHGTDVTRYRQDPGRRACLAQALHRMDGLTTVSLAYACMAAGQFGLESYPEVIPNFIDLTHFRPDPAPREHGRNGHAAVPGSRPRIVHVSNFRPVKDPLSMAEIFARIHRQIDAELWLIGDGPQMELVRDFFAKQGIERDVRYLGLCRNVAPLLAKASLLLMTSLEESFCLAALEAMACGVPVIATRVGGLPEVVLHGQTGYLVPVQAHEQAAAHAIDLLTNPKKHQVWRKAARTQARRFNKQYVVPAYEALYREHVAARAYTAVPPQPAAQLSYVMV